jgi:cytochrome c
MHVRVHTFLLFVLAVAAGALLTFATGLHADPPQDAAAPAADPSMPRSVWDGVYTEEQAKRGELVYTEMCAVCHGAAMTGGEMAGPLNGPIFTSNWNGVTVADLFDRIRTTMPLDRPGVLTRQQNADVLAYMFHANKFPAGKTELANRSEMLKQIMFTATKPE